MWMWENLGREEPCQSSVEYLILHPRLLEHGQYLLAAALVLLEINGRPLSLAEYTQGVYVRGGEEAMFWSPKVWVDGMGRLCLVGS
jgi:hypothetical protein